MSKLFLQLQLQQRKKQLFINLKNQFDMGMAPKSFTSFEDMEVQEVPTVETVVEATEATTVEAE